jgi:hypothetical protein
MKPGNEEMKDRTTSPTSEPLRYSVRRNRGTSDFPHYRSELSHLLVIELQPTDIVTLEETDRLFAAYQASAVRASEDEEFAIRGRWRLDNQCWIATCKEIGQELSEEDAVLFIGPYEYCGAVKVSAGAVFANPQRLLEFDKDTIRLQSSKTKSGLFLDLFEEDSVWFIELVAWGEWKISVEKQINNHLT